MGKEKLFAAVVVLTSLGIVGCGSGRRDYECVTLRGEVTIDGKSLQSGAVQFFPTVAGQGPAVGALITQGHYVAEGVPVGKVRVLFTAIERGEQMGTVEGIPVFSSVNLIPEQSRSGTVIQVPAKDFVHHFRL